MIETVNKSRRGNWLPYSPLGHSSFLSKALLPQRVALARAILFNTFIWPISLNNKENLISSFRQLLKMASPPSAFSIKPDQNLRGYGTRTIFQIPRTGMFATVRNRRVLSSEWNLSMVIVEGCIWSTWNIRTTSFQPKNACVGA